MLDLEVIVPADDDGLSILSLAEFKRHMKIRNSAQDLELKEVIRDAAAMLHGQGAGLLNRTIFPTTYKRYLTKFPDVLDSRGRVVLTGRGVIPLPYPPLIEVLEIAIEDGESPTTIADPDTYVVRKGTLVGEIELKTGETWPSYTAGPRAISVTYRAGYTEYPAELRRMLKILAAHNYENPEATINEPRQMMINRKVEYAFDQFIGALRVSHGYDNWGE